MITCFNFNRLGICGSTMFLQSLQLCLTWCVLYTYITCSLRIQVAPGNHEYTSYDPTLYESTKNFIVYNARFLMPPATAESKSMYYSFDYSYVHFVVYSTESSFPGAPYGEAGDYGDEISWIEEDLAKANENRANVPWIIALGRCFACESLTNHRTSPNVFFQCWIQPKRNSY